MMVGRGGGEGSQAGGVRAFGLHLMPVTAAVDSPRPSVLVELDPAGALSDVRLLDTVESIAAAVPTSPCRVAVDAPLRVANERGRREIERLLAWLDVPTFPSSRTRLRAVYGGLRGEELAAALADRPDLDLFETFPDLVLRLLAWESEAGEIDDLGVFRERWLGLPFARYRPKGIGRAKPRGVLEAWELVGRAVDLGGWHPAAGGDDWATIRDAAVIDATLCAYVAWRSVHLPPDRSRRLGDAVVPVDPMLSRRIDVNLQRLRSAPTAT